MRQDIRRLLLVVSGPALLFAWAGCATSKPGAGAEATSPGAPAPGAEGAIDLDTYEGPMVVMNGKFEPAPQIPMGDPATIERIIDEGKNRNQVMDHLTYLCTQIGARLTGSTNVDRANRWTAEKFGEFGLQNVHLWEWGTIETRFDRGLCTGRVVIARTNAPGGGEGQFRRDGGPGGGGPGGGGPGGGGPGGGAQPGGNNPDYRVLREMEFTTPAWSRGTEGPVRGPVIKMPATEEEYVAVKDKLKGAWVLVKRPSIGQPGGVRPRGSGRAAMWREAREKVAGGADPATLPFDQRIIFDGVAGFLTSSRDERVSTGGSGGWRTMKPEDVAPDLEISVRASDYDFINSYLADGNPIEIEFDLKHEFIPGPHPVYNTVAEIPGTTWPDELVIVSAHLDSWNGPGSQGTTDNGTGSAVTLEAARILMAVGAQPKRTIRFVHWTGEEQGLLGSRAYVAHLKETGELDRISAVFVDDGGTNYEGGLQCTFEQAPMLAAATAPITAAFPDMPVNIRAGENVRLMGGSDHQSFQAAGIPGFFWDEVGRADYGFGWHTQNDRINIAIPEYLVQSSTCAAVTAYNLACADSLLPRPAPRSQEEQQQDRRPRGGDGARGANAGAD